MSTKPAKPVEVFQQSFAIERLWVKEVVRAVLGAILFHRALGNTRPTSVEPVPADAEIDALLASTAETVSRALLEENRKSSKLVVALYPTPSFPRQLRQPTTPKPRPLSPPVTSALGWFSASAKALASGAEDVGQRQAEEEADLGDVWEAWILDIEVVAEGRRGVSEEKLRSQLNNFLLRSLAFVMEKTSHVPPITTPDLQPFGVQLLHNPTTLPFAVPKPMVTSPAAFPLLHTHLVTPARGPNFGVGGREGHAVFEGGR